MEFPRMRRKRQLLNEEEAYRILREGETGFLGVLDEEGYPYVVPLNYVLWNDCIYFHCAPAGHKLDAIRNHSKVSFCVVKQDEVRPATLETAYISCIAFGNAYVVDDIEEKRSSLEAFGMKYNPTDSVLVHNEIERFIDHTTMVRIEIDYLTGKQAKCLVGQDASSDME